MADTAKRFGANDIEAGRTSHAGNEWERTHPGKPERKGNGEGP